MVTEIPELDVEGPVQAEVFVLVLRDGRLTLTGPCGADPWLIELGAADHPVEVVARIAGDAIGPPRLVHSTSWRRDRDAVILTFLVVADEALADRFPSAPVARADLARSEATAAPAEIGTNQVLEHAIRHLAWLAREDAVVHAELSPEWHAAVASYVPEPFRALG